MKIHFGAVVSAVALLGTVQGQTKLQIIHSSDNESSFQDPNTLEEKVLYYSALANGLQTLASNEDIPSIHVTAGDHTIPGPFFLASSEVPDFDGINGYADIAFMNSFPNVANGIGNHEFDNGIDDFAKYVSVASYPFVAVNLDFSNVELADGTPPLEIGEDAVTCEESAGTVVKSCHITVTGNGGTPMTIGLIGRSPAELFNVVEDPDTTIPGLDFVGGRDADNQPLESAVPMVLEQVDLLTEAGATVIVLLDHAQDFTTDPLSASVLRGVHIIVSAGSSGFQADSDSSGPFNFLREGDEGENDYPNELKDSEDKTILVINSDQLYNYIGHLIVEFNDAGEVIGFDDGRSGPIATTEEAVALLATEIGVESLEPSPEVVDTMAALQATPSILDGFEVVSTTDMPLNGLRSDVRTRETNLGRLAADSTIWGGNAYASANGLPAIDVALKNGGGIRDSITGPSVIRLTIRAALAFNNKLSIVELTAGQLLATMENSVSRSPASDGRFPQIAGMALVYDGSKPGVESMESMDTPSRIQSLVITKADGSEDVLVSDFEAQGDLSRTFVMATNSFLLTGGDGYLSLTVGNALGETDLGEQQILEDYLVGELGGTVSLEDPPPGPRVSKVEGMMDTPTDEPTDGTMGTEPPTDGTMGTEPPTDEPTDGAVGSNVAWVACSFAFLLSLVSLQ